MTALEAHFLSIPVSNIQPLEHVRKDRKNINLNRQPSHMRRVKRFQVSVWLAEREFVADFANHE